MRFNIWSVAFGAMLIIWSLLAFAGIVEVVRLLLGMVL